LACEGLEPEEWASAAVDCLGVDAEDGERGVGRADEDAARLRAGEAEGEVCVVRYEGLAEGGDELLELPGGGLVAGLGLDGIPGHWEGDLLSGTGNSHIATLVERHSRFTILIKVPSKDTATVVEALTRQVRKLPASLRRSLTWDRGLEMAKHKSFTVATKVNVYFCDPQSPWQRGTNENTNGLLRQYFPKKTDLSHYSQADLDKVALQLNQRPRKTLGFETPAGKLQASVASTG
jgi:Integrase core domain